jgi:hypothetical protein
VTTSAQFVVLEWIDDVSGYPRYSFATLTHAEELRPHVKFLETHSSLELAAATVADLNHRSPTAENSELSCRVGSSV